MKKITLFFILTFFLTSLGNFVSAQDVIDPTTLNNKIMAGYQGWFGAPGDGSGYGWIHWGDGGGNINAETVTIDFWPDMREYDEDELFPTDFVYSDLSNAGLFSSFTRKTVERHFKWMKDYGIDGVFVQRFISSAKSRQSQRDTVLSNARWGAEAYGRVFANMYDMSGGKPETFIEDVKNDWMHLVDDIKITESPNYLHHNGLPVLSLWGVHAGGSKDILTPELWLPLVQWFTTDAPEKYRVTLKAGVNNGWRDDPQEWQDVYDYFEFISPWAVGRYNNESGADGYRNQYFQADLDETSSRGMDYIPVVFPGFSWSNLYEGKELNQIPRNGGKFLWRQFYNAIDAGCNMVYVAMFDEVDEGTAIFKTTENASQNPTTGAFVTLDIDGYDLPSDWYLRLTGEASKMLRGDIPITTEIPITPYPENAEFVSQDVPTILSTGETVTVSVTMKNNGDSTWTDVDKYLLGSISVPDTNIWGVKEVSLNPGETITPGESKTFTFDITAPGTEGVYNFEWRMKRLDSHWVGKPSKKRLINVTNSVSFLDDCDALTDWNSSSTLSLNTSGQKQGTGCIEFSGGSGDNAEFNKVFATPYNSGIATYDAILQFWYYISDASLAGNHIEVGLGSGGEAGTDEYTWSVGGIATGWNLVTLDITKATSVTGTPDLNAINWFSITNTKSGVVTTRIDEIQILDRYAGFTRYTLTINDGVGGGTYAEGSIVNITADAAPPAQEFIGWSVDGDDVRIEDKYANTTSIRMPQRDAEVSAQFKMYGIYLDDCDLNKDWGSSGVITLNTTDQKEGLACLEYNGSATDEYKKTFSTPYNSGAAAETAVLKFWYYVSDVSQFSGSNQVEIGSAGSPDQDEYSWNLSGLTNGWNEISLDISSAGVIGEPDLSAINWFRLYHFKSGTMTTRIDAIQIVDPGAGERYPLTVYNGSGSGNYYAGVEVAISAEPAPGQQLFDKWVIEEGSPVITDINAMNTTLITSEASAVIRATYRDVQKYTLTVNNGSGSGTYTPGATVVVQAESDTEDRKFIEWVVESGAVELSNPSSRFTYLTMPEEDAIITATFTNDGTGIDYVQSNNVYQVFPNPAKTVVSLLFSMEETADVEISMLDLSGRLIKSFDSEKLVPGGHQFNFPVADVQRGTYIINVRINSEVKSEMLIIQ